MGLKNDYSLIMESRLISTDNQHLSNIDLNLDHLQDVIYELFLLNKYIYLRKKNSLKQKDLFGYININANQSDFHIVHKIANKKPRGSKAFNSKKNVLTSLINKLQEKKKFECLRKNNSSSNKKKNEKIS